MKFCLLVFALSLITFARAREIHSEHFYFGLPQGDPETNDLIFRDIYVLSNNDDTKFAAWVAYRLTPHETFGTLDLERDWKTEPYLEEDETLEYSSRNDPYKGASAAHQYDRGHLAPLASFKGSRHASDVNYYSNIVPQRKDLNQGPWRLLEDAVRNLVRKRGEVWVITGPYYDPALDMPELDNANESHEAPSGYWKVVGVMDGKTPKAVGFLMPQTIGRRTPFADTVVPIDQIEAVTGLDLMWELPDQIETAMEADPTPSLLGELVN